MHVLKRYGFDWGGGEATRIFNAFQISQAQGDTPFSTLWTMIEQKNKNILSNGGGMFLKALDNPGENSLFYGFENLSQEILIVMKQNSSEMMAAMAKNHFDLLLMLGRSVDAQQVWNPEGGSKFPHRGKPIDPSLEDLLLKLDDVFGIRLEFPNPFRDELGLVSSRGIISFRAIQAIYQAWRVRQLCTKFGGHVVEIGAGLGRTAFFAIKFGVESYTIIDLPFVNISQANFLIRTLGSENVSLFGEHTKRVNIRPVTSLKDVGGKFNVVINVDSLTEMGEQHADMYARFFLDGSRSLLGKRRSVFLSINHEANDFSVARLPSFAGKCISRAPYWLRQGYIEELFCNW